MQTALLFVGGGVLLLESLLLFVAPELLARLAFVRLPHMHRIPLPVPELVPAGDPAYRDAALTRPAHALPSIPLGRRDLDDSVLVAARDGHSFALRRAYGLGKRILFLVRLDMKIEGDELVLRATQSVVPLSLPIALAAVLLARHVEPVVTAAFVGGTAVGFAIQWLFGAGPRDRAIAQAFDMLEPEIRATFPKKRKRAKKRASITDDDGASTASE